MTGGILTHGHVHDVEGEDVDGEQGEGHGEQVEVSVVPLAHAVPHPGAVVVEAICGRREGGKVSHFSMETSMETGPLPHPNRFGLLVKR